MKRLTLNQRNILRAKCISDGFGYFNFHWITAVEYIYLRMYFRRHVCPDIKMEYHLDISHLAVKEGKRGHFSLKMGRHFNPEDI